MQCLQTLQLLQCFSVFHLIVLISWSALITPVLLLKLVVLAQSPKMKLMEHITIHLFTWKSIQFWSFHASITHVLCVMLYCCFPSQFCFASVMLLYWAELCISFRYFTHGRYDVRKFNMCMLSIRRCTCTLHLCPIFSVKHCKDAFCNACF